MRVPAFVAPVSSLLLALAACARAPVAALPDGAEPRVAPASAAASASASAAVSASAPAPAGALGALGALCERHHVRERACAGEFLSALVALRIEVDMPRGIAAEAAREGREGLLAAARREWQEDMQPDKVSAMCAALDAGVAGARRDSLLERGERCLALPDCSAFAACAVADQRSFIESGETH